MSSKRSSWILLIYRYSHNTAVNVMMFESIVQEVQTKHTVAVQILQIVNPVAKNLLDNDEAYVEEIIEQLQIATT